MCHTDPLEEAMMMFYNECTLYILLRTNEFVQSVSKSALFRDEIGDNSLRPRSLCSSSRQGIEPRRSPIGASLSISPPSPLCERAACS